MIATAELVRSYIEEVGRIPGDPEKVRSLLHPEFIQVEFPNALNPRGQRSDLADCLKRLALAGKILSEQRFEVKDSITAGEKMVVEAAWEGRMAIDAGPLKAGQKVKADFCMIFEFKDGRIFRQRNYDCFQPLY